KVICPDVVGYRGQHHREKAGHRPNRFLSSHPVALGFESNKMLTLGKYSIGVGDRFARQAGAQLRACLKAAEQGVEVIPVWNKSNREHITIGSEPSSVRAAADVAVREGKWDKPYHVDADHIRLETVDRFIPHSDFYTM